MKRIHVILIVLALAALMVAPTLAAPKPANGTTLAGYKTIDICVVDPTDENPYGTTWRYSGEIAVWNEGAVDTVGFTINDFIEYKTGTKWIKAYDVFTNYAPGEIPAGTTQLTALTFPYSIDAAPLAGDIRNNAKLTILNHSGYLGKPFGPNPKATYAGPMPPPPCEQDMGCTLTQGYWGTHSKYGPAPYDPIWETVGEDTGFFLSETTWYGAITTNPKGNGYWILSNQYVAAILNMNNGAYVPQGVQETLDLATAWFATNTPGTCSTPGSCGTQKDWAAILDDYNNGLYPGGPPHCE